jgi:hypothetical protein
LPFPTPTPPPTNTHTRTPPQNGNPAADIILLSGCKDAQTSADATIGGIACGALTWAFLAHLPTNPGQSYAQLLQGIRALLAGKYAQIPQISSSRYLDLNQPVRM